jgi:hypothetical protein
MKRTVTQRIAKLRKDVYGVMVVMIAEVLILSDSASFACRLWDGIEACV